MKTQQIVFTKPCTAELLTLDCLPPENNEVTVQLEYSAISAGTEKANFIGDRNSINISENDKVKYPVTVGYSASGVVTDVGCDVKDIAAGDRVIVF